jgi:N,N'-diacetyllegionaminate synthase
MLSLKETFKLPVGYSDHTLGIEIPIAAATLGATVIEKHLTLDKNLPGPDHQASLEPDELQVMVSAVRNIEKALGNGVKEPGISEIRNMALVRKSLIATGDLERGHILRETDITIKRPGTGLHPKFKELVIGMKLTKNVREEDPIEWEVLKES